MTELHTEHLGERRKSITPPPSMSELRAVLLGKNSSEISRVGNFILGRDAFDTEAPPPLVEQHSEKDGGTVEGRYITLINTPHLFHPQLSAEELNQRVRECMTLCSPGPHVLMLVLQPDDFTEKDLDRLHHIFQSLSEDPYKHTLVLKTENKDNGTVSSDQEIIVQKIIAECSNRCLELRGSSSAVVKMMEEMFSKNGGQYLICKEFEDAPLAKPQKERIEQEFGQTDLHKHTEHLGERRKSITPPPSMSELRAVLLGKNSSEISRVGNFILGRDAFNTEAPPPLVEQHSEKDGGTVEGRYITLINTPHLFHPQLSAEELNHRVRECMTLCSPGPHVLMLVLQPDDFTEKDLDRLHHIFQSLSEDPYKHTLVLKTENKDNGTVGSDQEIIVQKIIAECSNRCLELRGSSSAVVKMMEEMFSKNGGQYLICKEFEDAPLVKPQKERIEQEFGQTDLHKRSPRLNLIVCGNDGSVKSSISDLILGQRELSAESRSVCVKREAEVCGCLISLVELPALYSSQLSEEEVMRETLRCVSLCDPGVHAFLLVLPVGCLTDNDKEELEKIQQIFGSRFNQHTITLITTETQQKGVDLDKVMQTFTETCRGGYYTFGSVADVSGLIDKVQQLLLEKNGDLYTPLTFLDGQVETQLRIYKNQVSEMKKTIQKLQRKDGLRIVLLGRTGSGKSATGNTVLRKENTFKHHLSSTSVTTECQRETAEVNGRQITVIDTPGLFDTRVGNVEIQKEITKCIFMAAPGPHVFLLVLRVGQRFSEEEKGAVEIVQNIFGKESVTYTMLLFTGGDLLEDMSIEEYFGDPGSDIRNLIEQCGNRFHIFNNKQIRNRTQVTALLEKIDSMLAVNGGSCYTNEMFQQVEEEKQERILKEKEEEIERQKEELRGRYEAEIVRIKSTLQEMENENKRREKEFKERKQIFRRKIEEKEEQYKCVAKKQAEEYENKRKEDEKRITERENAIISQLERQREEFERQRHENQKWREQEQEKRRQREEQEEEKRREREKQEDKQRRERAEQERIEWEEKGEKERYKYELKLKELKQKCEEEEYKRSNLEERIKISKEKHMKELDELKHHLQKELEIKVQEEAKTREKLIDGHQGEIEHLKKTAEMTIESEIKKQTDLLKDKNEELQKIKEIVECQNEQIKIKDEHEEKRKSEDEKERRVLEEKIKQIEEEKNQLKDRLQEEKKQRESWQTSFDTIMKEGTLLKWQQEDCTRQRAEEIQELKRLSPGVMVLKMGETCTQNPEEKSKLDRLMSRLNLSDHNLLKVAEFLEITKSSQNCPASEINLTQTFLKQLLMMDYRARYCIRKDTNEMGKSDFLVDNEREIHPMDVQMAVFHCSDSFLKQLIVTKLSQCQYALPLLVPNPFTGEIEFPLWTFRQVQKSWKTTNAKSEERMITMTDTPMVAFFRFGSVSTSKSQLMNRLINEKHDTFFHRDCPGSRKERLLMDGVVEIAWYLPSGKSTDHFSDCVAFCNLHGDAGANENQYEVVTRMSSLNVFLLTDFGQKNMYKGLVRRLFTSHCPLICLLTDDDSVRVEIGEGKYTIGLKGQNQYDVCQELKRTIRSCLTKQSNTFKLENVFEQSGLKTDEDDGMIKTGKETARQIVSLVERGDLSKVKEKYLPFQGKLWHDWCQKNKELHRPSGNNIDKYCTKKRQEMKQIRDLQKQQGPSELIKLFLKGLNPQVLEQNLYLVKWVEILLNKLTTDGLHTLHQQYDEMWSKVLELKKTHDTSEQQKTELKLINISNQLNAASFGLEHILREMGQIFEASQPVKTETTEKTEVLSISSFPAVAAELIISGYPLELMDGDAAHVPLVWVSAVLDEVIRKLGDQRVFVLSVLGIQSSGKSTMLNAMFGLQFAVSAGRCTRGAFMQLVKVSEEMKEELKFDYILVVDTEGLRALELTGMSTRHHDNELATFVVGLGNLTLINIFGENPSEMQDFLQIVVQAFLRMKQVRLNPSCMFVHQNVPDVTAEQKNMEGRRRLQEKLDEMTKLAAQEESCDAECFSDVIAFDVKKDVRYFVQLWEGTPPMAPQNTAYSDNVEELKKTILYHASQCDTLNLTHFKSRIKDLWDALLHENFVFSFRNTLEITVYRKLEEKYGIWTWSLRSAILKIQDKLYTSIKNNHLHEIKDSDLVEELKDTCTAVKESMKSYFEEHQEGRDLLQQWKGTFEKKIDNLHDELVKQTKRELDKIICQKETYKKLEEQKTQYEETLFEKSKEFALSLKSGSEDQSEMMQFGSVWKKWVSELTANIQPMKEIDIEHDIVQILSETLERPLVCSRRQNKEYEEIDKLGDFTKYVKFMKLFKFFRGKQTLEPKDQESIRTLILTAIKQSKDLVQSKPVAQNGYNPGYIQEIAMLVKKAVTEHKSPKYQLTKEFLVDLSMCVCENAKKTFEELQNQFRNTNDPMVYLMDIKPGFYSVFQKFCEGATSVAAFGALLCSKLGESIDQSVYSWAANELAGQMRSDLPELNGNRSNLEKHILKSLAEEEDFEKLKNYLISPRDHFENFIKDVVKNYMKKENPKTKDGIEKTIDRKKDFVISAAETATKEVRKAKGDAKMWLKKFSDSLKNELELTTEPSDKNCQDISDFQLLTDVVKKEIQLITEELKNNLNSVSALKMENFRKRPDEILIDHFCQCCWAQCPFCKAICTNTLEGHPGDHSVPFHRSCGINGWIHRGTENLSLGICTLRVKSDKKFWIDDKEYLWREYRKAGGEYAKWSITPDLSELPYWKWVMCKFQKNLESYYKKTFQGNGQIPDEWRTYTKEKALESLDKYF